MPQLDALEQVLEAAEAVVNAREDQMLTRVEWDALAIAIRNARSNEEGGMTTYLVATLARYVLVDAHNENAARELGAPKLHELYADLREKHGRDVPIHICTVRPATVDEIELQRFHDECVAREREIQGQ